MAATTTGDAQLFEEEFTITEIDAAKYDSVARLKAISTDNATQMTLDFNTELFPLHTGEMLHVVLATTLNLDGTRDDDKGWRDATKVDGESTLADVYDYVCHGKIYKFEDGDNDQSIKAYVSFGGLLMSLQGPYKKLTPLRVDYTYLLIKK